MSKWESTRKAKEDLSQNGYRRADVNPNEKLEFLIWYLGTRKLKALLMLDRTCRLKNSSFLFGGLPRLNLACFAVSGKREGGTSSMKSFLT